MKQGSTIFLRVVIFLIGLGALAFCLFALPRAIMAELAGDFDYGPIFLGMYVSAVPFFGALYQSLRLLGYIDKNAAFSELSVKALKNIKYCGLTISGLYAAGMPYIFYVADRDDAPGVVAVGLVIVFASFVVAVFAAVLEKLLRNAIDIKAENDLTV
ncbi:MAG TPA: DUF2975 domain-containing protein [Candidatus Paceibacterota bacterium]|nr:DUF2975 domain-containing protein [Candidatus Paceibacterota bacterium]